MIQYRSPIVLPLSIALSMNSLTSGGRSKDPPQKPRERKESAQPQDKLQTPERQATLGDKKAFKDHKQSADEDKANTAGDPSNERKNITELHQMGVALSKGDEVLIRTLSYGGGRNIKARNVDGFDTRILFKALAGYDFDRTLALSQLVENKSVRCRSMIAKR